MYHIDSSNVPSPRSMTHTTPDKYFETHLSLSTADANALHFKYYREYGLAIEGLVRHHKVDALDYNRKVDDALPLEDVIKPNPELRRLLEDIDRSKIRLWLFTNAYVTHGKRVVRLLQIEDMFEGMTYCDYGAAPFACKPHVEMFDKAMREAGVKENKNCYFVGESFVLHWTPNIVLSLCT
jgi:pyrimidine and pyridine-specific 5'-nucleotidase